MPAKNVLHIVEDLGVGGLERVLETIVLKLNRSKFAPQVWCLAQGGEIADDLLRAGVEVRILGMRSYHNPLNIIKLSRHLRKAKIDIIHTHGYFASTFGRTAAILAGTPVIITHIHTAYIGFKKRNILIERLLSLFTDKIVCVSRFTREFVEKTERIGKNKICLIYNGSEAATADKREIGIDRSAYGIKDDDFVIITVASLVAHKGHRSLIAAVGILLKEYRNLRLMLVGDGPLSGRLKAYVENMRIAPQIVFTGQRKNVTPLLKMADLFVLPSIEREGLGVALIEAMAQGLALVGTRVGGIPELIENNVNGLLVHPDDPISLAAAIRRLINDKSKKEMMANLGRKIFEKKFSSQIMMEKIELLYDSCTV